MPTPAQPARLGSLSLGPVLLRVPRVRASVIFARLALQHAIQVVVKLATGLTMQLSSAKPVDQTARSVTQINRQTVTQENATVDTLLTTEQSNALRVLRIVLAVRLPVLVNVTHVRQGSRFRLMGHVR